MKPLIAVGAIVAAWLLYENARTRLGVLVRRNTPSILRAELRSRSAAAGILGPVLGTEVVSEVVGMIAQKTLYDSLPTIIGPREYDQ